ncbi:MAG: sulfatase-like hydrolase/transferase [Peptococcaceae bacterium]|nr:sulfatase-like hydrolase/transferase [Peptococcaceae bacterium]
MTKKASKAKNIFALIKRERFIAQWGVLRLVRNPILFVFLGIILSILALIMIFQSGDMVETEAPKYLGIWRSTGFLMECAVVSGMLFCFRAKWRGKLGFWLYTILFAAIPFGAYYMIEVFNGMDAFDRQPQYIFMNYMACLIVYMVLLAIFGSYRWSVLVGTLLLYLVAGTNYFVMIFRGTPFVPLDIFAAGTGFNVADHYKYELSPGWLIATVIGLLLLGVGMQLGNGNLKRVRWKLAIRALAVVLALGLTTSFFSSAYLSEKGYAISYWDQASSYEKYGNWLAFCLNLGNVFPEKPDGYSPSKVSTIIDDTLKDSGVDPDGDTSYNMLTHKNNYKATTKKPNIIVIMNESFMDVQSLGDVQTSEEVMPFFKSLKENTIRGNLQVSTVGGGTACTEFEVLTGNSQLFLQPGAVAYSANMRDSVPSMAWSLAEQGYQTEAFHPYYGDGWNRDTAYKYLGFDKFTSIEDIVSEDILGMSPEDRMNAIEAAVDPDDGDVYNRDYMSDHYDFKLLRDYYNARDKDKPYFMFNVTIQNHSGYGSGYANFDKHISITNMNDYYPQAEAYLTLVRATDDAFKELITYYKEEVKEPTIIVMYGDHLPTLDEGFFEEVYGKPVKKFSTKELQSYYQTPFVIWANYDIPEKNIGTISDNYLSTLVMQTAGLELTDYNRYLASLYKTLPAISKAGITDSKGKSYRTSDESDYVDLITGYQSVAYNNLLDYKNRDWSAFTIDGQALPSFSDQNDSE